jgi:hypothetical protein
LCCLLAAVNAIEWEMEDALVGGGSRREGNEKVRSVLDRIL